MNNKITGLILTVSDYKENDSLTQVLTKEYGIISLIAKGSKKITSHHHYLPFHLYEFIIDYLEGKTIFVIKSAKLLHSYFDEDIKMMSLKNVISEILIKNKELVNEETCDETLFIMDSINDNNKYLLMSLFVSKLLKLSGIVPYVDGCVECEEKKVIGLSNIKGGFVCKNHALDIDVLDVETLKKIRLIIKADYKNYNDIKDIEYGINELSLLCDFYVQNSGIKLKSYDFYKTL